METQAQNITSVYIEDEMKGAYLDYAMSVIVGRALPDVRDGLKPVHRRILYAMYKEGLGANKRYSKCAGVVGEVLKRYHPHGDMAVYDSLVRMAQPWNLRYPLVDGQGNFGSLDGDPPAAYRYTEARMTKLAEEMLVDIEKETVNFIPNFDESTLEPLVMPGSFPNLLINGSAGIAVGMATNIPPHNLSEVIEGSLRLIDNPELPLAELTKYIPGPDFPTAGFICGKKGIKSAYETGRGIIHLRAKAIIEKPGKGERESIIITELPYQVNKAKTVEKIAHLIKDKKIEGISDLRDESDREGMRIVIDLKKGEMAQVILNKLYKMTQLQESFGIILLALVKNQPRVLNLKALLEYFIAHRLEVITRRTKYELKKAQARAHILEGLKIAVSNIDEVVRIIKQAKNPEEAAQGLIKKFALDSIQARAILEMRLQRLTGLEREKINQELAELKKKIETLTFILANEEEKRKLLKAELSKIKEKYGDPRRTKIVKEVEEIAIEDLIMEEDMVVTISHVGYIKRNPLSNYRSQKRGGKGIKAMGVKEKDFVEQLFVASTHTYILFFTNTGKVHWLKVYEIPQAGREARGTAIVNLLNLSEGEKITVILSVKEFEEDKFILMATERGIIKKTALSAFSNPRSGGIIALILEQGDRLIDVKLTNGKSKVLLATKQGQAIVFSEDQVRVTGRVGRGVIGVRLSKDDQVINMETPLPQSTILTVTENGYGKRSAIEEYRVIARGGKGVINIKTSERNGKVAGVKEVQADDELMIIANTGKIIRLKIKNISVQGRNTQGVRLIRLKEKEKAAGIARLEEKEEDED